MSVYFSSLWSKMQQNYLQQTECNANRKINTNFFLLSNQFLYMEFWPSLITSKDKHSMIIMPYSSCTDEICAHSLNFIHQCILTIQI